LTAAEVRPDGRLQYLWTDSLTPPCLTTGERTTPTARAALASSPGRRAEDLWVDGPGGPVHALVTVPEHPGPHPTVLALHGGPHEAARDAYDPLVNLLVHIGFAVVRVNYRGSTGYGPLWRRIEPDQVGFAQLEDLDAVRARAVDLGVATPGRTAVCGESWGGYLALLAAGTQPDLWLAVAALSPVADYAAAYRDTTAGVRALDRSLLGGSPRQVPERYARVSPITYVDRVRAPVLVVAGKGDHKCPPAQISSYVEALTATGAPCELVWTDDGHDPARAAVRVQALATAVHFLGTAFARAQKKTTSPPGGGSRTGP
jgi:dipeptidyl aminopeptidase/acylaminoacyl peptidase